MAKPGLQWLKQPDGTLVLWDPSKGQAPLSAGPTGPQAMPGTDTSDVARQMFEDKQGTASPSPTDWLSKNLPEAPPTTGDPKTDFNALINAFLQKPAAGEDQTGEGGQSLGTGDNATPVTPTTGEETSRPAPKAGKTQAYAGGQAFVDGLIKRGWTPDEAAAAAGNAHVESGFKPGVKSSVANEQSYGFLQWNGKRLQGLKNMAKDKGLDWQDPEAQLDYIHMERTGESAKYGGTDESAMYKKALSGGGSPAEMAERFGKYVERPKDLSQSVKLRMAAADQYAALTAKSKGAAPSDQYANVPLQGPAADPMNSQQPFSNQTMNEEMFSSILNQSTGSA